MQGKKTGLLLKSLQKEEEAMNMDSENCRLRFEGLNRTRKGNHTYEREGKD